MKEHFRKSADKPVRSGSVKCRQTDAHCFEGYVQDRISSQEYTQQPSVFTVDTSQQRTVVASGKVCRQYQRRRLTQSANNGDNSTVISRLGIASNLIWYLAGFMSLCSMVKIDDLWDFCKCSCISFDLGLPVVCWIICVHTLQKHLKVYDPLLSSVV